MQLITNQLRQGGHPYWYFPFRLPWLWQLWQQYQLWWLAVTQVAVVDCDIWHHKRSDGCGNNNRYNDCDVSYTVTPVTLVIIVAAITLIMTVFTFFASQSCDCSDECDASFSLKCDALFLKRKHLWTIFMTKTFLGFDSEPIFFPTVVDSKLCIVKNSVTLKSLIEPFSSMLVVNKIRSSSLGVLKV